METKLTPKETESNLNKPIAESVIKTETNTMSIDTKTENNANINSEIFGDSRDLPRYLNLEHMQKVKQKYFPSFSSVGKIRD